MSCFGHEIVCISHFHTDYTIRLPEGYTTPVVVTRLICIRLVYLFVRHMISLFEFLHGFVVTVFFDCSRLGEN